MRREHDQRSFGGLLKDLKDDTLELFREEVALARTETIDNVKSIGRDMSLIGAGLIIAHYAILALLVFAGIGLVALFALMDIGPGIALWLSPLVIGLVLLAVSITCIAVGKKKLEHEDMKPDRTMHTMQENKQWINEKLT